MIALIQLKNLSHRSLIADYGRVLLLVAGMTARLGASRNQGEPKAGIAGRRLDQRAARAQRPVVLERGDHRQGGAILE
jgi:hypothetical protein